MRQEYKLGDTTNPNVTNTATPNTLQASFWWTPNIMIILNNTSNPVFLNETRKLPNAISYDRPIPAGGQLRLPTDSNEFAVFLPLTPALTDLTAIVTVIFDQLPSNG